MFFFSYSTYIFISCDYEWNWKFSKQTKPWNNHCLEGFGGSKIVWTCIWQSLQADVSLCAFTNAKGNGIFMQAYETALVYHYKASSSAFWLLFSNASNYGMGWDKWILIYNIGHGDKISYWRARFESYWELPSPWHLENNSLKDHIASSHGVLYLQPWIQRNDQYV